jgi:MOSC domain-containing protein YiiM
MQVASVNTGRPREFEWKNTLITTAIFKTPVNGPVAVKTLNLAGDEQADLTVHGGEAKAVYFYPHEHYSYWTARLGESLGMGSFGENLTIEGLSEKALHIGDELEIGTALFRVRQPRTPCWKLGVRFGRDDMTRLFYESRRFGAYFSVLREGDLQTGDEVRIVSRDPRAVSVADIIGLFTGDSEDPDLLERAISLPALPAGWRRHFEQTLTNLASSQSGA